ncbi:hypothetical protein [Saccharopolyspora cebuensis]|uniref:Uncharacterized protein n=1 Tax=Saccharopolyspora cebuensis TaxID=418759 RepID=A0ABV4CNN6_9PSEU
MTPHDLPGRLRPIVGIDIDEAAGSMEPIHRGPSWPVSPALSCSVGWEWELGR